jgi:hypothetical protein
MMSSLLQLKKFPETILAHAEAVKNIKTAVEKAARKKALLLHRP